MYIPIFFINKSYKKESIKYEEEEGGYGTILGYYIHPNTDLWIFTFPFDYYTFIQLLEQPFTVLNAIIYNILPVSLKLYHIFQAHEPPMTF